jgi:hypothetical protein
LHEDDHIFSGDELDDLAGVSDEDILDGLLAQESFELAQQGPSAKRQRTRGGGKGSRGSAAAVPASQEDAPLGGYQAGAAATAAGLTEAEEAELADALGVVRTADGRDTHASASANGAAAETGGATGHDVANALAANADYSTPPGAVGVIGDFGALVEDNLLSGTQVDLEDDLLAEL